MTKIVFVYDFERSKTAGQFSVRLEERVWDGRHWRAEDRTRVYFADDLLRLKHRFADVGLCRAAMESEIGIRKTEGGFFSGNVEFTSLRIAAKTIKRFLDGCSAKKILCRPDGRPVDFAVMENVRPDVYVNASSLNLYLNQRDVANCDYSNGFGAFLVVFQTEIFLLPHRYFRLYKSIPFGKSLSSAELDQAKRRLTAAADQVRVVFPQAHHTAIVSDFVPVFDLASDLKIANLFFKYGQTRFPFNSSEKTAVEMDKNRTIVRDEEKEKVFIDILTREGLRRSTSRGEFFLSSVDRMAKLKRLEGSGFEITIENKRLNTGLKSRLSVRVENETIVIHGDVSSFHAVLQLEAVMAVIDRNEQTVVFSDDSVGIVSSLREELDCLLPYFRGNRIRLSKNRFADLSLHLMDRPPSLAADGEQADRSIIMDDRFKALVNFLSGEEKLPAFLPPESLEKILRPYQQYGFMWLCNLKQFGFGGILADDMGLGKSLQILAYLLKDMAATAGKAKTLLVVPKTLVNNWELEILKFAPSLKYSIRRDRKKPLSVDKSDLIITTYGLIRTAADQFEPIVWQNLILDEAQYIKNYYTQTSRALRGIRARTRLALTGTPLENSLTDLFSIFDFLMPGFLGTMKSFKQRYHQNRPQDLETLGQLTKPFLLRRLKKQVCHELPSKTEISILCELSKTQAEVYRETLSVERSKLREPGLADNAVNMLTVLLRLRQIACHLKLLDGISVASSGKLDSVLQMAEEILAEGHSILIFSQFTQHLDIVKKAIQKLSVHQYYLDGGTKDRMAVVTAFQDDVRPAVFLISLKTGGVGLNLTRANYVFLLDPWWNPAVENQAIDRCYRIGQSDPVTVYRFISKDTIEEKIMKLKALKKQIEESVILTAGADQIPLSESDLKWLIFEE